MTRIASHTLRQSEALSRAMDRCRDAVAGYLERNVWVVRGGFVTVIMLQIALLAHTLTLAQ